MQRDTSNKSSGTVKREEDDESSVGHTSALTSSLEASKHSQKVSTTTGKSSMGETTLPKVTEHDSCLPDLDQQSSKTSKGHANEFSSGRGVTEAEKSEIVGKNAATTTGSDEPTERKTHNINESSSGTVSSVNAKITTNSASSTNLTNISAQACADNSEPVVPCTSASDLCSKNRINTVSQRPSVLDKSANEETQTPSEEVTLSPSQTESGTLMLRDKSKEGVRNISVIDIKRETEGIGNKKHVTDCTFSDAVSSKSNKSREINYQQQRICPSDAKYNSPTFASVRGTITTDIPQSLSTDSGIGSPLDGKAGIDPAVGHDIELGQDGKWKMENCPVSSLATGVVPPISSDRAENYPPCIYHGDGPFFSSSSDTSNYLSTSTTTGVQSFHANADSKHDSGPENSPKSNENGNLDLECGSLPAEKEVIFTNLTTPVSVTFQKASAFDETFLNLKGGHSRDTNTRDDSESALNSTLDSHSDKDLHSSVLGNEKVTSVIHTIQTSEFTVEYDISNSSLRNKELKSDIHLTENTGSEKSSSKLFPDPSDKLVIETNLELSSGNLNNTCEAIEGIIQGAAENEKEDNIQDVVRLSELPPTGRKFKGILKTTSAPSLGDHREKSVTLVDIKNGDAKGEITSSRSVSFNQTHTKNTFSYNNVAFEGEIITEPSKRASLVEVVSQMMRQSYVVEIDEDNSHPYGRDNSLTDLMTGKRRDSYNVDAGKMIVWLALAIMIVSLAGGIIFMSETYSMGHRDQGAEIPRIDTTTPEIAH